jgi:uncharacterized protein YjbI with pentapeptide repeats
MKAPRFKLSTVLTWMTIFALLIAWYRSLEDQRAATARLTQQLLNAQGQIMAAEQRGEAQVELHSGSERTRNRVFAIPKFEGVSLRDMVIQGGTSSFQLTSFDNSDLTGTSLTGGGASFQEASFKNTILRNAKLVGGASSFQLAVFENADLSGATLVGNLQSLSLKNATCVSATIQGSFQGANIDGAQFEGADLTGIERSALSSCYFATPPSYDAKTKFPDGFNPREQGWKLTANSEKK